MTMGTEGTIKEIDYSTIPTDEKPFPRNWKQVGIAITGITIGFGGMQFILAFLGIITFFSLNQGYFNIFFIDFGFFIMIYIDVFSFIFWAIFGSIISIHEYFTIKKESI